MTTPAMAPKWLRRASNSSICERNSMPAASATPTQIIAPSVLSARNRSQPMRIAPASGGAMMASPGMNLATSSELMPHRSNRLWVWLTQESGSREILHRVFKTLMP